MYYFGGMMADLSPEARGLLVEMGKVMINKRLGRSLETRQPEEECFELGFSWCKENKAILRRIAQLAKQAEKKLPRNFEVAAGRFLEQIATNPTTMHFLVTTKDSGFGIMLASSVVSVEAFTNTCRVLQELAR